MVIDCYFFSGYNTLEFMLHEFKWCLWLIVLYFEFSVVLQISYMQRRNQNGGHLPAIAASPTTLGHHCQTAIRPHQSCIRPMEKVVLFQYSTRIQMLVPIIYCICVGPCGPLRYKRRYVYSVFWSDCLTSNVAC